VLCRGLHKRYGATVAVRSLDLEVKRGECFGLLGPNGAGKTTTVEILEGLTPRDGGDVAILGMRWETAADRIRRQLGVQLQETELPDKLTVLETVRLFRSLYPSGSTVDELIDSVGLAEKRATQVRHLSGGQRQRLSLTCALAGSPDLLFLDEPTTGLDPASRRQLWSLVETFLRGGGTVLLTTHFMDEAEKLCDRVAILDEGKVLALGTPRELIRALGAEHVIEFSATVDLPTAELVALPGVDTVSGAAGARLLGVSEPHRALPGLLECIAAAGGELSSLHTHHATLDDVFLALTGRQLRDE
jgi:ABC-2 type transport system ATP-binding protein